MKFFNKNFGLNNWSKILPSWASSLSLMDKEQLETFLAELDEAMKRIAAGTASPAQYFVVFKAWPRLFYLNILYLEQELGYVLPGGRPTARLLLVLFLFFGMWAWPF